MIVSENCIALAGLLFAASRIDAWAIVVNPRLSPRELDQIGDHSGARRVFFTAGVSREAADHAARCQASIGHIGPLNNIGIGALNEQAIAEPVEETSARQVAVLIYTSGTTGTPKGVMLSHENLLISAKTTAWFRKMDANDKVYVVLPISHIVGISLLIMTLMSGATVRLVSKYDPAALARAIAEEGITILNGVPATYQRLLEYKTIAGIPRLDRGSLRLIAVAGAPLDLDLKSRVQRELGLSLLNGYGITECSPGISGVRIDSPRDDQAVGTLLPGIESRIVDLDGALVPDGQVGELHVRGPQRDARLLSRAGSDGKSDRCRRLVQHRGSRALRWRLPVYRRTNQGNDHPLRIQRLSRGSRGGAQFAWCRRAVCRRRPRDRRQ